MKHPSKDKFVYSKADLEGLIVEPSDQDILAALIEKWQRTGRVRPSEVCRMLDAIVLDHWLKQDDLVQWERAGGREGTGRPPPVAQGQVLVPIELLEICRDFIADSTLAGLSGHNKKRRFQKFRSQLAANKVWAKDPSLSKSVVARRIAEPGENWQTVRRRIHKI